MPTKRRRSPYGEYEGPPGSLFGSPSKRFREHVEPPQRLMHELDVAPPQSPVRELDVEPPQSPVLELDDEPPQICPPPLALLAEAAFHTYQLTPPPINNSFFPRSAGANKSVLSIL